MLEKTYDPFNWYWIVVDSGRLYSSSRNAYVDIADATYLGWVSSGGVATKIANATELNEVLAHYGKSVERGDTAEAAVDRLLAGLYNKEDARDALIAIVRTMADLSGETIAQMRQRIINNWPNG